MDAHNQALEEQFVSSPSKFETNRKRGRGCRARVS